jgi:hypothetical protein
MMWLCWVCWVCWGFGCGREFIRFWREWGLGGEPALMSGREESPGVSGNTNGVHGEVYLGSIDLGSCEGFICSYLVECWLWSSSAASGLGLRAGGSGMAKDYECWQTCHLAPGAAYATGTGA